MAEYTRGIEDRGNEMGEPVRTGNLHRRTSSLREEFEGMNFEQNRDAYRREHNNERWNDNSNGEPTSRRAT